MPHTNKLPYCVMLLGILFTGCASQPADDGLLVLDYDDFGPQCVAYEFIGYDLYQWEEWADGLDLSKMEIKVVVYDMGWKAEAMKRYPVIVDKQDYRYVSAMAARGYLIEQIEECHKYMQEAKEEGEDAKDGSYEFFEMMAAKYTATLNCVEEKFFHDENTETSESNITTP